MRLLSLTAENFGSYVGKHELSLDKLGLVQVSGRNLDDPANDSNGSGKSTLLEALTWCLFGEGLPRRQGNTEKGISADEVCNDRLGKQCSVEVLLEDDQVEPSPTIGVVRWRKYKTGDQKRSNGVTIQIGDAAGPVSCDTYLDISEGDRRICQVLGIDRDIWCRSVIFGQESQFNFCEATSKERADILTTVLGLEQVDRWLGRARDERTTLRAELANLEGQYAVVAGQQAKRQDENPEVLVERWEGERGARLAGARAALTAIEEQGKRIKAELTDEEGAKERVQQAIAAEAAANAALPPVDYNDAAMTRLVAARAALATAHQVAQATLATLTKLQGQGATCPLCGQEIKDREQTISQLSAQYTEESARRDMAAGVLSTVEAAWNEAQAKAQAQRGSVLDQIQAARAARVEAEQRVTANSLIRSRLEASRAAWQAQVRTIKAIEAEVNPYVEVARARLAELATLAAERAELDQKLLGVRTAIAILDWWEVELPRFKTWLFDSIVDALAAEANRWLRIMSGGVIWIQVSTTKQLKSGETRDDLDVTVWRWNPDGTTISRPYRLWSGGEKRRVALAVDLGLSRLMASRASKAYRFLALDEIDRHLDAQGREGLRSVLDELRSERETCLIITHDPELRASFDVELAVTKQGGCSRLEVKRGKETREEVRPSSPRVEGKADQEAPQQASVPGAAEEASPVVPADAPVGSAGAGSPKRKRRARADAGADPTDDGRGGVPGPRKRQRTARARATEDPRGQLPGTSGGVEQQRPASETPPDQRR